MTHFRDFFSNNNSMEPSALLSQGDLFSQHGEEESNATFTPSMFDDWLVDELCKSGLIPAIETTPISPSLSSIDYNNSHDRNSTPVSPPNSVVSVEKSNTSLPSSAATTIPLFPDIHSNRHPYHPPSTISQTPSSIPVTATSTPSLHHLPRLAPRPSADSGEPVIKASIVFPLTGNQQNRQNASNNSNGPGAGSATADEIALKRQRNTDAARRSRMKKLLKLEQLEKRVADLETENQGLTTRIAVLESEKQGLSSKDDSHEERIRVLEAQLTEAYKALTNL
ncbi:hypothetical protein BDF20DRAFT_876891 [Mycotypha africana]|uniref:uncharacterized protein n=1 Tax=Mycotypha africana TaxID=64632 RepID=UPI00230005AE|nr:uncharacterized protein BDF20DRAFT_876891 [Mycotypha africana]KAI8975107.1 hypothetical protein BDF20DRAFT_876891 [Mycotypha africana]